MNNSKTPQGLAILSFAFFIPAGFLLLMVLQSSTVGMFKLDIGDSIFMSVLAVLLVVAGSGLLRRNYYYGYVLASALAIYFIVSILASIVMSGASVMSIALLPTACALGIVILLSSRYREEFRTISSATAEQILAEDAALEINTREKSSEEEISQEG